MKSTGIAGTAESISNLRKTKKKEKKNVYIFTYKTTSIAKSKIREK